MAHMKIQRTRPGFTFGAKLFASRRQLLQISVTRRS
jgi:hypothetical protein